MNAYAVEVGVLLTGVAVAMMLFGAMPIVAARLISLVFSRTDPRRQEMVAEVRAVPRWERPIWVGEQLGRVFTEAIPDRVSEKFRPTVDVDLTIGARLDLSGMFGRPSELVILGARDADGDMTRRAVGMLTVNGHEELFAIPFLAERTRMKIAVSRRRRNKVTLHVGEGRGIFTLPADWRAVAAR